jgi:post-segregation antitoxin (ccd killing protein)
MFISKTEKNEMQAAIRRLQAEVRDLSISISTAKENAQPPEEKKRRVHKWTDENRAQASARMKESWVKRKAAKEAS